MPAFLDLSNKRFGNLVVKDVVYKGSKNGKHGMETKWRCVCDCGNEKIVGRGNLKSGAIISCGCSYTKRLKQGGYANKHPLWSRWTNMISRCTKSNDKNFKAYGARGINVCDRWLHFPSFLEDMADSFFEGATIERKNNDGDYEPDNCRWAPRREQLWNQRRTIFLETPWGKMSRGEVAYRMGIPVRRLIGRIKAGWSMERLFDKANWKKLEQHGAIWK